nr:hypothetical protein [uncultured Rhodopila sp.]
MVPALDWQASTEVARSQLDLFHDLSDRVSLTPDDRRRALNLTERDWRAWHAFLADGPIPAQPPLPEMLRRLGHVAFNLTVVAEGARGVT